MLWLASWPVRWGLLDLTRFVPLVLRAQKLTSGLGSDRSGMMVRLFGFAEGKRVERRWTLIASKGDGPEIPGLAAAILVDRLATGSVATGARDAGELLTLAEFEPAFSASPFAMRRPSCRSHRRSTSACWDRVLLGCRKLSAPCTACCATMAQAGAGTVTRGSEAPCAGSVAAVFGFPAEGEHALHVSFSERDGAETWTRDFSEPLHGASSRRMANTLVERWITALRLSIFAANGEGAGDASEALVAGAYSPCYCARAGTALAGAGMGRGWPFQHFDVPIALPLIAALVVHYRGWLERPSCNQMKTRRGPARRGIPQATPRLAGVICGDLRPRPGRSC